MRQAGEVAVFVGGFTAAEGCFYRTGRRFGFAVAVSAPDAAMCELTRQCLGVGRVRRYERRRSHFHDEVVFSVQSIRELLEGVVPFMDQYLPNSKKRVQYLAWREQLFAYWEESAKRRRPCNVDGCERIQRAKGVCRRHYYLRFGR